MNHQSSKESVSIPTVTCHDSATGLPVVLLKPAVESAIRRREPITITIYPEDLVGSAPGDLSELDEILAEIIEDSPGLGRSDIEEIAERKYSHTIGTDGVNDRFRQGRPLPSRGYRCKARKYYPPESDL